MNAKGIVLALLLLPGLALAGSVPPSPGMQFYGTVGGAKNGTVIKAVVGQENFVTHIENGHFGYSPNVFIVEGYDGNTVKLYIGGTLYKSYTFESGELVKIYVKQGEIAFCGDGTCNNGETYTSCPLDCPPPTEGTSVIQIPPTPSERNITVNTKGASIQIIGATDETHVRAFKAGAISCKPLKNAYEYLDVEVNGPYSKGIVTWNVPLSWYKENDLNVETTTILHCKNGQWENIGAHIVEKNATTLIFRSGETTFSAVALTAEPNAKTETETETNVTTPVVTPAPEENVTPSPEANEANAAKNNVPAPQTGPTGFALLGANWLWGIAAILILLGAALYVARKR